MGKESTMVKVKKENNEANNVTITPLTISIEPDQSRSSLIINPRTHSLTPPHMPCRYAIVCLIPCRNTRVGNHGALVTALQTQSSVPGVLVLAASKSMSLAQKQPMSITHSTYMFC